MAEQIQLSKLVFPFYKFIKELYKQKVIIPTMQQKLIYFPCRKGNEHEGQVLNYVCVQKNCKSKGLLCSICKNEHNSHEIIPLKMLFMDLQASTLKRDDEQKTRTLLEKIEQQQNITLYELKLSVEALANKFRELQQEVIRQYEKLKLNILEEMQVNFHLDDIISQAFQNKVKQESEFIKQLQILASQVQYNKAQKKYKVSDTTNSNIQKIMNKQKKLQKKLSELKNNINNNLWNNQNVYGDEQVGQLYALLQQPYIQTQASEKKVKQVKTKNSVYEFSPNHKASSIQLKSNKKIASQTKAGIGRFVLVSNFIGGKFQKISFKINRIVNWIGIGICIRNQLMNVGYKFNYNKIGHGSYLVSNNKFSWSHTQASDNIAANEFGFFQNDIIDITLTPEQLKFVNRKDGNSHTLKLKITQKQWAHVCFCANLCNPGDEVQIVSSKKS